MGTVGNAAPILIFRWEHAAPTLIHVFLWERSSYSVPVIAPDSHSNCLLVNSGTNCKLWNSKLKTKNKLKSTRNQVLHGYVEVALQFSSRVSILTRDIDIANLSVRPSVRPSVTFR